MTTLSEQLAVAVGIQLRRIVAARHLVNYAIALIGVDAVAQIILNRPDVVARTSRTATKEAPCT